MSVHVNIWLQKAQKGIAKIGIHTYQEILRFWVGPRKRKQMMMTHMITEMNPGTPQYNFFVPPKEGHVESQRTCGKSTDMWKVNGLVESQHNKVLDGSFAELAVCVR